MATATLKNLENLNLEALGAVDLSNDYEALTQTVGGRRGNVTYRSFSGSSNTSRGFVQEQNASTVDAYDNSIPSLGDVFLGTMTRSSNGSYSGRGVNNLRLFANRLLFNNADTVFYEGIR